MKTLVILLIAAAIVAAVFICLKRPGRQTGTGTSSMDADEKRNKDERTLK